MSGGRPSETEHHFRKAGVPLKKLGGEAGPSEKGRGALREAGGPPQRAGGGRAPSQRQGVPQKSGASIREGGRPSEKWRFLRGMEYLRGGVPQKSGGPSEKGVSPQRGGGSPQTRGSTHRRRSPQRSGSPREARGTGSRRPATSGAGPSLTEVAWRLCGRLRGPGWPREAGSGPISSGPAAAAPSGGACGGGGDRTTDDRPTDCAGGAERARVAGVRVRAPGR